MTADRSDEPNDTNATPLDRAWAAADLFRDSLDIEALSDHSWHMLDAAAREAAGHHGADADERFAEVRAVHAGMAARRAVAARLGELGLDRSAVFALLPMVWNRCSWALNEIALRQRGRGLLVALREVAVHEVEPLADELTRALFDARAPAIRDLIAELHAAPTATADPADEPSEGTVRHAEASTLPALDAAELHRLHRSEPWRFMTHSEQRRGFELIQKFDEEGHSIRVLAKRVLFGYSPTIWAELWVAQTSGEAKDFYETLVAQQRRNPEFRKHEELERTELHAASGFRLEGRVDGQESVWFFLRDGYFVAKVATFKIPHDLANTAYKGLDYMIWLGSKTYERRLEGRIT